MNKIILILLLPSLLMATSLKNLSEIRVISNRFMSRINHQKYAKAFQTIRPYYATKGELLNELQFEVMQNLSSFAQKHGTPIAVDLVSVKKRSDFLIRLEYIQKYHTTSLRWLFIYYKNDEGFILITLILDNQNKFDVAP